MEKIYAPYVLYKDNSGFIYETKLLEEIDLQQLLNNNGYINTYYGERLKIESINGNFINGNIIFVKEGKITEVSIDNIIENATNLFTSLAYEAINAPYMNYKRDVNDTSKAEDIAAILKNFGYNVDLENNKKFNKEDYLKISKELSHYYSIHIGLEDKEKNEYLRDIKRITLALNTIIAENDGIDYTPADAPKKHFMTDSVEENGETKYYFKSTNSILYDAKNFKSLVLLKNNRTQKNKI